MTNSTSEREQRITNGHPQMDWQQVVLNGGPPCFAQLDDEDGYYCGRAERWAGHGGEHKFVSLNDLIAAIRQEERRAAFRDVGKIIDDAGEEWSRRARDRKSKTYSAYTIAALDLKGRITEAAANESVTNEATLLEADNNLLWINPVAGAVAHYKAGAAFLPYRLVREDGDDG